MFTLIPVALLAINTSGALRVELGPQTEEWSQWSVDCVTDPLVAEAPICTMDEDVRGSGLAANVGFRCFGARPQESFFYVRLPAPASRLLPGLALRGGNDVRVTAEGQPEPVATQMGVSPVGDDMLEVRGDAAMALGEYLGTAPGGLFSIQIRDRTLTGTLNFAGQAWQTASEQCASYDGGIAARREKALEEITPFGPAGETNAIDLTPPTQE